MKKTIFIVLYLFLASMLFAEPMVQDIYANDVDSEISDAIKREFFGNHPNFQMNRSNELWVDPVNGDDGNLGTEAYPYLTLYAASLAITSGTIADTSIINLVAGEYVDEDGIYRTLLNIEDKNYIKVSGSASGEVTFKPQEWSFSLGIIFMNKRSNGITIENINFDFSEKDVTTSFAIPLWFEECDDVVIQNCSFADLGRTGDIYLEQMVYFRADRVGGSAGLANTQADPEPVSATTTDKGFNLHNRAELTVSNCTFDDWGREAFRAMGWVDITMQNCTYTRSFEDFGYTFWFGDVSQGTIDNCDITGAHEEVGIYDSGASIITYSNTSFLTTNQGSKTMILSNNHIYHSSYGLWLGSHKIDGTGGNIVCNYTLDSNDIHDCTEDGIYIPNGHSPSGTTINITSMNNEVTNCGRGAMNLFSYTDATTTLNSYHDSYTANLHGLRLVEYFDDAPYTYEQYPLSANMKFTNFNGNNKALYAYVSNNSTTYPDDVDEIDMTYSWWGGESVEDAFEYDTDDDHDLPDVNYEPYLLEGPVTCYTQLDEENGSLSYLSVAGVGAGEYLDIYRCGTAQTQMVTDLTETGLEDYHRMGMIWGIVETGTVTADLEFNISTLNLFDEYTAYGSTGPILLRRTVDVNDEWTDWSLVGTADWNGTSETMTLSGEDTFGEYALAILSAAPEITEPVINTVTNETTYGWGSVTGADSYKIYKSRDVYADNWTYVEIVTSTEYEVPNDGFFYKVEPFDSERPLTDPSVPFGGFSYECVHNNDDTSINIVGLPILPPDGTPNTAFKASDLGSYINDGNTYFTTISKWDKFTQSWYTATYIEGLGWGGDFTLIAGESYMIGAEEDFTLILAGIPPVPAEGYLIEGPTTNGNFIMLQIDSFKMDAVANGGDGDGLIELIEVGNDICGNNGDVNQVSYWSNQDQAWYSKTFNGTVWETPDFVMEIGMPYMFFPTTYIEWPTSGE